MTDGNKIMTYFYSVRLSNRVKQHDIFWLQIRVNQSQLLQFQQSRQNLQSNRPDVLQGQRLELVGLEKIIQVLFKHLKDQTCMILVRETLVGSYEIIFIRIFLGEPRKDTDLDLTLSSV